MSFKTQRYPKNWRAIREGVRLRTNNQCAQCRAPNGEAIVRADDGRTYMLPDGQVFDAANGTPRGYARGSEYDGRLVRVVLTVAHLDHDETNNDPDNLAALCQKCHLAHDRADNQRRAQATRQEKAARLDRLRGQAALPLHTPKGTP